MTKLFVLMALIFSAKAFACPHLTGKWMCYTKDKKRDYVSIKQEDIEGGVLYQMTNMVGTKTDYYADGKESIWMEGPFEKSKTVTCDADDTLQSILTSTYTENGDQTTFYLRMQLINEGKNILYTTGYNSNGTIEEQTFTCQDAFPQ